MRRLFVLFAAGATFFALVATAVALTNNDVRFTGTLNHSGKPSKSRPAPASFHTVTDFFTSNGTQPNVASTTTIYFPKQLITGAKYFPSCSKSKIDGKPFPSSCKKAIVGKGSAQAAGGTPGQPINPALRENLTVTAVNGPKGKSLLLVLNGTSPVNIVNRVVVGKMSKASGKFGFKLTFTVPFDLQYNGLQTPQTHFDVTIKKRTLKKGGKKRAYIGLAACPKSHSLPTKTVVNYAQDNIVNTPPPPHPAPGGQVVTRTGTVKC